MPSANTLLVFGAVIQMSFDQMSFDQKTENQEKDKNTKNPQKGIFPESAI